MKRTLLILTVLCIFTATLFLTTSCKGSDAGVETPDVTTTDPGALIAGKEGSVFSIVYPAIWSDYEYNAATSLKTAFSELYQSSPKMIDDSKTATDYEILISTTNRSESTAAIEGLNEYGWAIRVIGNRIAINAKNGRFLTDAVEYFIRTYVGSADQVGINNISDHIENVEKYGQPYMVSVGRRSAYTVDCSTGSNYLKSSATTVFKQLEKDQSVSIPVSVKKVTSGKTIKLAADEKVNGWKIVFEESGNISILGNTDALAVCGLNHFRSEYLKKDADGDILIKNTQTVSDSADDYTRSGWLLAAPAYENGTLAQKLYDCGTGMQDDNGSAHAERSFMMCISNTTAAQFDNYLYKLSDCGYEMDSENIVKSSDGKNNQFYGYRKGSQYLWVYYLAKASEVRVIEDRASTPESEFEYEFDYDSNTATEVYLYGMKYDPYGNGYTESGGSITNTNNGNFIIIKQADNSVMLIDGGFYTQATSDATVGLWQFLHEITGKASNEKIVISCWFVTHPHGDHYALVSSLISCYSEHLDLQRVMFNFPSQSEVGNEMGIETNIRKSVNKVFPNAMFAKCHTGQSIKFGSMIIDVMTTHEDAVSATTGKTVLFTVKTNSNNTPDGNDLTSVLRFTFADGTRYMELGDFSERRDSALVDMYAAGEFKCDIADVAHHGYNQVQNVYNKIAARYVLWSNHPGDASAPFESWDTSTESGQWRKVVSQRVYQLVHNANSNVEIYYAGLNTAKLECKNKIITVTLSDPVY